MEPAFTTEFDITSVQVGETRSIICAEGEADKYGHVFVTYELDSAGDRTGGTYSGSARAFPGDDTMIAGVFRGIWRRNGANVVISSVDDASNGDLNFTRIELDVQAKKAKIPVYPLD